MPFLHSFGAIPQSHIVFPRTPSGCSDVQQLVAAGGIQVLVDVARDGNEEATINAAGALWNLARNAEMNSAIAAAGGIQVLVDVAGT